MGIRFFDHGFADMGKGRTVGPCRWDRFDLLCVHKGSLLLTFEHQPAIRLPEGEGVLIYPATFFCGEVGVAPCRISVQHFGLTGFAATDVPPVCQRLWGKRNGFERVRWRGDLEYDARRATSFAFKPQTRETRALREAQLQLTLASLVPVGGSMVLPGEATPLHAAVSAALETLGVRASVDDLANATGFSVSHFRRHFRRVFGETPRAFLQRYRLGEAARLLRETGLPTKTISQRVGYTDVANFHHAFRRRQRMTPAAYRAQFSLKG